MRQFDELQDTGEREGRRLVESARDAAERVSAYAQAKMGQLSERAQDLAERANGQVAELTGRPVESWTAQARGFIRDHPFQAIAVVIGIGYLLGKLSTRS